MVKNSLIGKKLHAHCRDNAVPAPFVGLQFILNKWRGVMVNREFRSPRPPRAI
jgi:hypothetical protein